MQSLAAADVPPPITLSPAATRRFRRTTLLTFILTLLLIVVGGIVRLSDSGLGCGPAGAGIEGWPFCDGGVIPSLETKMVIEYAHRALASAVGLLLIAMTWMAWRHLRSDRTATLLTTSTLILVIGEGLLGALTVETGLHPWVVAIHLGVSMAIAALLMVLWLDSRSREPDDSVASVAGSPSATSSPSAASSPSLAERGLAIVSLLFVWSTIFVGGYVAGTQLYGTPGYEYSVGAHMACGDQFPQCLGGWWPWGMSDLVDAQLAHRLLMYLAAIAVIAFAGLVLLRGAGDSEGRSSVRASAARRLAAITLFLLVAQILLGAANVWYGEHRGMILAHLSLGTLLWLAVVALARSAVLSRDGRRRPQQSPPSPQETSAPAPST